MKTSVFHLQMKKNNHLLSFCLCGYFNNIKSKMAKLTNQSENDKESKWSKT